MFAGKDSSSNEYTIPDKYFMTKDVIAEQIEILEKLFSNQKLSKPSADDDEPNSKTPAKKPKTDANIQQNDKSTSSPSSSSNGNVKKITADQLKKSLDDTMKKSETTKAHKAQTDGCASTSKQATAVTSSQKPSSSNSNQSSSNSKPLPSDSKLSRNIHDYINVVLPKGNMAKKLEAAAPYNFFLTTITASKPTHNEPLSITFQGNCI